MNSAKWLSNLKPHFEVPILEVKLCSGQFPLYFCAKNKDSNDGSVSENV